MKESVELTANSLIFIGLTLRTFLIIVSDCVPATVVHEALPTMSPLNDAEPEVTLKVALTLAPGAIGSANVFELSDVPETTDFQCDGTERLNLTPVAGDIEIFLNVTVVS